MILRQWRYTPGKLGNISLGNGFLDILYGIIGLHGSVGCEHRVTAHDRDRVPVGFLTPFFRLLTPCCKTLLQILAE